MIGWSWKKLGETTTDLPSLIMLLNQRMVKLKDVVQTIIGAIQITGAFANGTATPSVYGASTWQTSNTVPTSITAFSDGQVGQRITVWSTTANTTIVNSATLRTKSGANVVMTATQVMEFITYDGIEWREA